MSVTALFFESEMASCQCTNCSCGNPERVARSMMVYAVEVASQKASTDNLIERIRVSATAYQQIIAEPDYRTAFMIMQKTLKDNAAFMNGPSVEYLEGIKEAWDRRQQAIQSNDQKAIEATEYAYDVESMVNALKAFDQLFITALNFKQKRV